MDSSSSSTVKAGPNSDRIVAYIFDYELAKQLDKVKPIKTRGYVVHSLIEAYGLLSFMKCLPSREATDEELASFHSGAYMECLSALQLKGEGQANEKDNSSTSSSSDTDDDDNDIGLEYGIGYDCPPVKNIKQFVSRIAGGTLAAVESILNGQSSIAINWCGGWHHAQRDEASGFCYVNDIVIGIQKLESVFKKILYIDLDSHHGDGVENAFSCTKKVFTMSIHNFEPGFFPGTGNVMDVGNGRGKYYAANVPYHSGINDRDFFYLVQQSLGIIMSKFDADIIVVQCGSDCLSGDPLCDSNLTEMGLGQCINLILQYKLPTILLGGGGYNIANAARCWTYLTSLVLNQAISTAIPEHSQFLMYGPDFDIHVTPSIRKNYNTPEYISSVLSQLRDNLQLLVPSEEVGLCFPTKHKQDYTRYFTTVSVDFKSYLSF